MGDSQQNGCHQQQAKGNNSVAKIQNGDLDHIVAQLIGNTETARKQTTHQLKSLIQAFGTENYPGQIQKCKIRSPVDPFWNSLEKCSVSAAENICDAVKNAPDNKGIARSMPETTDQENQENIDKGATDSLFVSAKGNVNIFGQEPGQRNVPALPKRNNVGGLVWRIEIYGKIDIE